MEEKFTFKSLRELRSGKGLSQNDLAQLSGISREHINRIEQGHLHLSGFTAPRIALVFKVNYKSMMISQELANNGLNEDQRKEVIAIALKEAEDLSSATIDVIKTMQKFDDFGDRDSFGRKKSKKQIDAEKRAEKDKEIDQFDRDSFGRRIPKREADLRRKEAKKKREDLDFGSRDSFGRKIIKKTKKVESDEDITLKEFFDKDESTYEERFKALILKGEQRRKGQ